MKRYEVIVSPDVEAELNAAYEWIAREAPGIAIDWYEGAIDAMESLRRFPLRCGRAPEARSFGRDVRQLTYKGYRILFVVAARRIYVLHIVHAARRPIEP